jgi:hypothetical protein
MNAAVVVPMSVKNLNGECNVARCLAHANAREQADSARVMGICFRVQ